MSAKGIHNDGYEVDLGQARQVAEQLRHVRLVPRDDAETVQLATVVQLARSVILGLCQEVEVLRGITEASVRLAHNQDSSAP